MKSRSTKTRRPKWHLIYFILATFVLITVSGSLYLSRQIMGIYGDSVDINQTWARRLGELTALADLAQRTNAPGNDVFDTGNILEERARRDASLSAFDRQLTRIQKEINRNLSGEARAALTGTIENIGASMKQMVEEADAIFRHFENGEDELAGRRMASMNRKYAMLTTSISKAVHTIQEVQKQTFARQLQNAERLRRFEYSIGAFILLMVIAVLAYGHKITRVMRRNENALNDAVQKAGTAVAELTALKTAIDEHCIVATTDTTGTIIGINDMLVEISGYSREELIGQNHRLLKSGFHPDSFYADMYRTIANGDIWHGELKNRAKDGSYYWMETTITPIKNASGRIEKYIATRTDLTSRKTAEALLQSNLDILNTTFDNFPGGISVYNKDLVLEMANPAFYQLLDIPPELITVGTHFETLIRYIAARGEYGDGDVDEYVRQRVALAKKFAVNEFKRPGPNGTHLEIKDWPLPEGGMVSTFMDITESENLLATIKQKSIEATRIAADLHRARDEQDLTHQHLLSSVNSMRNGFIIWGSDDRLVLANDAYRDFLNPIRDMIVEGVRFEDVMSAGFDCGVWDLQGLVKKDWLIERTANRRAEEQVEKEIRLADGRQIVVSDLALENGEVITTVIDITAHRQREKELQDTKQQLEQIAYFDGLTGLANRAHCQKDMAKRFADPDPDQKFAIIQIDLDNFKRVNDTLGHAAGDFLLGELGHRMRLLAGEIKNFKSYRWGGDEFIALVERDDTTDLAAICEELTDLISVPLQYEKKALRPTVSLGVARYPEDARDLESLMIFSDLALYKTKELGRDGYQFFTFEMKENIDAETRIERDLRVAIDEDQLELYFQPQIDIDEGTITGVEALLRWNHPENGLIMPTEFMPITESHGMARQIGCQVIDMAMKAARQWLDDGLEFGRLAINLSPQHLKKSTILDDFFGAMEKYRVEPRYLAVEFLESFIFDDPNANILDVLKQFCDRGIHVALDDFGTGYASLSHLSTMPLDGLKIDKSFVHQMTDDPRQQGIIAPLNSMAKLLSLDVVCEGVETEEQMRAIAQIGNCSIQGFYVAPPMKFEFATRWIGNRSDTGAVEDTLKSIAINGKTGLRSRG